MRAMQKMQVWRQFWNDPFTNQIQLRKTLLEAMGRKDVEKFIDATGQGGLGMMQMMANQMAQNPLAMMGQMQGAPSGDGKGKKK
jgi:hypothetical protein